MHKVVFPALCATITIGGLCGPDGVVTGMIAEKTIFITVVSYCGLEITDWLLAKLRPSQPTR